MQRWSVGIELVPGAPSVVGVTQPMAPIDLLIGDALCPIKWPAGHYMVVDRYPITWPRHQSPGEVSVVAPWNPAPVLWRDRETAAFGQDLPLTLVF